MARPGLGTGTRTSFAAILSVSTTVESLLDAYAAYPPSELELSELALRGHRLTDERESDDEYDYDGLAAALGE
jgi:hypothetical protein